MKIVVKLIIVLSFGALPLQSQDMITSTKFLKKEISKVYQQALPNIEVSDSLYGGILYTTNSNGVDNGYLYIGRVNCCRRGGCQAPTTESNNNGFEYFEYFTIYNTEGTVLKTRIFNYQATYGQQVCAKPWLKQFIGLSPGDVLQYDKDIDAISGATISVVSFMADIEHITKLVGEKINGVI